MWTSVYCSAVVNLELAVPAVFEVLAAHPSRRYPTHLQVMEPGKCVDHVWHGSCSHIPNTEEAI
jgi:hypothetical protein